MSALATYPLPYFGNPDLDQYLYNSIYTNPYVKLAPIPSQAPLYPGQTVPAGYGYGQGAGNVWSSVGGTPVLFQPSAAGGYAPVRNQSLWQNPGYVQQQAGYVPKSMFLGNQVAQQQPLATSQSDFYNQLMQYILSQNTAPATQHAYPQHAYAQNQAAQYQPQSYPMPVGLGNAYYKDQQAIEQNQAQQQQALQQQQAQAAEQSSNAQTTTQTGGTAPVEQAQAAAPVDTTTPEYQAALKENEKLRADRAKALKTMEKTEKKLLKKMKKGKGKKAKKSLKKFKKQMAKFKADLEKALPSKRPAGETPTIEQLNAENDALKSHIKSIKKVEKSLKKSLKKIKKQEAKAKKAKWVSLGVGIAVAVVAIAAIVLSGGALTPLALAGVGAAAGASSAIAGGAVMGKIDPKTVAVATVAGGVGGFAGGVAGGAASSAMVGAGYAAGSVATGVAAGAAGGAVGGGVSATTSGILTDGKVDAKGVATGAAYGAVIGGIAGGASAAIGGGGWSTDANTPPTGSAPPPSGGPSPNPPAGAPPAGAPPAGAPPAGAPPAGAPPAGAPPAGAPPAGAPPAGAPPAGAPPAGAPPASAPAPAAPQTSFWNSAVGSQLKANVFNFRSAGQLAVRGISNSMISAGAAELGTGGSLSDAMKASINPENMAMGMIGSFGTAALTPIAIGGLSSLGFGDQYYTDQRGQVYRQDMWASTYKNGLALQKVGDASTSQFTAGNGGQELSRLDAAAAKDYTNVGYGSMFGGANTADMRFNSDNSYFYNGSNQLYNTQQRQLIFDGDKTQYYQAVNKEGHVLDYSTKRETRELPKGYEWQQMDAKTAFNLTSTSGMQQRVAGAVTGFNPSDFNRDGVVDAGDLIAARSLPNEVPEDILGTNPSHPNFDINRDGAVDAADITAAGNLEATGQRFTADFKSPTNNFALQEGGLLSGSSWNSFFSGQGFHGDRIIDSRTGTTYLDSSNHFVTFTGKDGALLKDRSNNTIVATPDEIQTGNNGQPIAVTSGDRSYYLDQYKQSNLTASQAADIIKTQGTSPFENRYVTTTDRGLLFDKRTYLTDARTNQNVADLNDLTTTDYQGGKLIWQKTTDNQQIPVAKIDDTGAYSKVTTQDINKATLEALGTARLQSPITTGSVKIPFLGDFTYPTLQSPVTGNFSSMMTYNNPSAINTGIAATAFNNQFFVPQNPYAPQVPFNNYNFSQYGYMPVIQNIANHNPFAAQTQANLLMIPEDARMDIESPADYGWESQQTASDAQQTEYAEAA